MSTPNFPADAEPGREPNREGSDAGNVDSEARFDETLSSVLQDSFGKGVAPKGLLERLLNKVHAEAESTSLAGPTEDPILIRREPAHAADPVTPESRVDLAAESGRKFPRLRWAALALIACSLCFAATPFLASSVDSTSLSIQCIAWLESVERDDASWHDQTVSERLRELAGQFRLTGSEYSGTRAMGTPDFPLDDVAKLEFAQGQAWRFQRQGRAFYLIGLEQARTTTGLDDRWRVLQQSGPWMVVARRVGDEVYLVAARHDISVYFRPTA